MMNFNQRTFYMYALFCASLLLINSISGYAQEEDVTIQVDFSKEKGSMEPFWSWFGHDEPNYTYMKDGKKLLSQLADLSPVPVYMRVHNLLVTGEGTHALKWGSTNAYTEDSEGNPVYDWTIIDRIFDTYVERGMKPFVEIGFMPKALSSNPEPYQHSWKPGAEYEDIYTGWAYPPKDYEKFAELIYQWVKHSVDRYGKEEVESWYWELWNEPNIGYWQGTTEEYIKLYDYVADAVKRALPTAKFGGPQTTGPGWEDAAEFMKTFLDHIVNGKNHVTGEKGAPLDFITYHAKGNPKLVDGMVQMNMGAQLNDIDKGFEIIASYPELRDLPVMIGESDPEGCAACSEKDYPHNAYRNGTMYSSYTAASFARVYEMADARNINLRGVVTWAFEFENQPWFAGFRSLATNGVNKPVLNVFRMFGMMEGQRVEVNGDLSYDYKMIRDNSVRGEKHDINALASKSECTAAVMVWNYHDDNKEISESSVTVNLENIPSNRAQLFHYRIDQEHSNSYERWKEMGSPQNPTDEQIQELEEAGQLKMLTSPKWLRIDEGGTKVKMTLPFQGVSLLYLRW